jgi:chloramphenicol O-acetyltransferase type A
MNLKFTPIDPANWPRAEEFHYFSKMAPTGYSICMEMDVTVLRKALKDIGKKFFPAYLYLITRAVNQQQEFKTAVKDGVLGFYETLTPLYACFHEDDKTISLMWTEYSSSFEAFYSAYLIDAKENGGKHGILSKPSLPPENCYIVSCVPWLNFTSFSLHSYTAADYFLPSVEAGKFIEKDGKTLMPLSVTAHHAATDGYHVNLFYQELQRLMNHPESWIAY